jgi:hypothetical protein
VKSISPVRPWTMKEQRTDNHGVAWFHGILRTCASALNSKIPN